MRTVNWSKSIQTDVLLFFRCHPMSSSLVVLPASDLSNKTFRLFKFPSGKGPFLWHDYFFFHRFSLPPNHNANERNFLSGNTTQHTKYFLASYIFANAIRYLSGCILKRALTKMWNDFASFLEQYHIIIFPVYQLYWLTLFWINLIFIWNVRDTWIMYIFTSLWWIPKNSLQQEIKLYQSLYVYVYSLRCDSNNDTLPFYVSENETVSSEDRWDILFVLTFSHFRSGIDEIILVDYLWLIRSDSLINSQFIFSYIHCQLMF